MTVITRMRRHWFRKQGRLPPEDVDAVITMMHTFGQRDGETEEEFRARLKQQNDEYMAKADLEEEASS